MDTRTTTGPSGDRSGFQLNSPGLSVVGSTGWSCVSAKGDFAPHAAGTDTPRNPPRDILGGGRVKVFIVRCPLTVVILPAAVGAGSLRDLHACAHHRQFMHQPGLVCE